MLDVSANKGEYVWEPMRTAREEKKTPDMKPDVVPQSLPPTLLSVAFTRHVAQMLYVPLRIVEPSLGIQSKGTRLTKTTTTLLSALSVNAMSIGGWKLGPYHLAAVRLQNRSTTRLELDPRQLQGRFYAASFQHHWLGPAGNAKDTTTFYLITRHRRPEQAILSELELEKSR